MISYCWICGQIADSAEHRIKKSDLTTLFGSGSYRGKEPVLMREGREIPVQGPNSKHVKYANNLCSKCNNEFSQPFDKAYERFISYIRQNKSLILKRRFIDFQEVYGDDFIVEQCNLYKYFVKSFGCKLNNYGDPIPKDLLSLLPRASFRTRLRISFSVNEDKLLAPALQEMVGKGNLYKHILVEESQTTVLKRLAAQIINKIQPPKYRWSEYFEWFHIWYWYNFQPDGRLGSAWNANSQFLYLGSHEPLSNGQREELLKQLNLQPTLDKFQNRETFDLGEISGTVTNTIHQLQQTDRPHAPELANLLTQLQTAIESDPDLSDTDKTEALEQVSTLAKAGQNPQDGTLKKLASLAIKVIKGTAVALPATATLVEAVNKLLLMD